MEHQYFYFLDLDEKFYPISWKNWYLHLTFNRFRKTADTRTIWSNFIIYIINPKKIFLILYWPKRRHKLYVGSKKELEKNFVLVTKDHFKNFITELNSYHENFLSEIIYKLTYFEKWPWKVYKPFNGNTAVEKREFDRRYFI